MSAVSRRFRAHGCIRSDLSAISLLLKFAKPILDSFLMVSGQILSPTQPLSSIATSIMITTSSSPAKGSGMPNRYGGDLLHTMGMSGLSRVRPSNIAAFL